jgi:hypothetical protein
MGFGAPDELHLDRSVARLADALGGALRPGMALIAE